MLFYDTFFKSESPPSEFFVATHGPQAAIKRPQFRKVSAYVKIPTLEIKALRAFETLDLAQKVRRVISRAVQVMHSPNGILDCDDTHQ